MSITNAMACHQLQVNIPKEALETSDGVFATLVWLASPTKEDE